MKNLSPKQKEQLTILIEECAEVQQCATKLLRFGIQDEYTSLDDMKKELGDLLGIIDWVVKEFDIDPDLLIQYGKAKQEKMLKWTNHQKNKLQSDVLRKESKNSNNNETIGKVDTTTTS